MITSKPVLELVQFLTTLLYDTPLKIVITEYK